MGTQRFSLCPINGIISLSKSSFAVPWKGMDFAVKHKIHSLLRCVTICEAVVVSHRVVVKCIQQSVFENIYCCANYIVNLV